MNNIISTAIENKQCLTFTYEGCERNVEPHTYGVSNTGKNLIRAYQIGGRSRNGQIPDWRLFDESKMRDCRISDEKASMPRNGYKKGDKALKKIYAEI